jgi:hypothetical protein
MGWSSGAELAEEVWGIVRGYVPKAKRKGIAIQIIDAFEDHDCDTMNDAETLWADAGLEKEEDDD